MATASNLPGPGRGLGKLYSRGGRILERSISLIAHKLGFGPYAVSLRMFDLITLRGSYASEFRTPELMGENFRTAWNRMLMYIQCVSLS
jgi:hypothetical protein